MSLIVYHLVKFEFYLTTLFWQLDPRSSVLVFWLSRQSIRCVGNTAAVTSEAHGSATACTLQQVSLRTSCRSDLQTGFFTTSRMPIPVLGATPCPKDLNLSLEGRVLLTSTRFVFSPPTLKVARCSLNLLLVCPLESLFILFHI